MDNTKTLILEEPLIVSLRVTPPQKENHERFHFFEKSKFDDVIFGPPLAPKPRLKPYFLLYVCPFTFEILSDEYKLNILKFSLKYFLFCFYIK